MDTASWIMWAGVFLCVVTGLIGTLVPVLPGPPLVFVGLLLAAWQDNFHRVGWGTLTTLFLLMVLSLVVDFIATSVGARRAGASRAAGIGAAIGTLIGIFFLVPGIIIGPFLGAVVGELLAGRPLEDASKAGIGTWVGLIVGIAFKVALAFCMVGIFVLVWFT